MRDEARYLAAQAQALERNAFFADETLKRAFARSVEIIGEAAKQVPEEVRRVEPSIPPNRR